MATIHFDKDHRLQVVEDVAAVHDKILAVAGVATPLIQVASPGQGQLVTVNGQQIRYVTGS